MVMRWEDEQGRPSTADRSEGDGLMQVQMLCVGVRDRAHLCTLGGGTGGISPFIRAE